MDNYLDDSVGFGYKAFGKCLLNEDIPPGDYELEYLGRVVDGYANINH